MYSTTQRLSKRLLSTYTNVRLVTIRSPMDSFRPTTGNQATQGYRLVSYIHHLPPYAESERARIVSDQLSDIAFTLLRGFVDADVARLLLAAAVALRRPMSVP